METKIDEAKLRNQFQLSKELQHEFANDFESFKAFTAADLAGRIRNCMGKCSMMSLEEFRCSEELERLGKEIEKNTAALERAKAMQAKSDQADYEAGVPCAPPEF